MLITDIAGNVLTVKRAWDGSVLATHVGATVYAPRLLTVVRGVLGTAAATHLNGAAVAVHAVPGLVRELAVAEALNLFLQESAGYARTVGEGDSLRMASAPVCGTCGRSVTRRSAARCGRGRCDMAKLISGPSFAKALEAAGIVSDLDTIERIVIDVQAQNLVKIHVQRTGDERLIDLAAILAGGKS